jgi:Flp pilus assembly protein TadD
MAGDFQGAEATLREILKVSPGNPIAMNNLGYFLIERGLNFEEATELIRKAVDIDPTNPSYLDSLGWAYFKLGRFEEAEKYLKEAARTDPTSSTILEHLGDLYIKLNNAELASVNFERSLNLATDPADQKRLKEKLKRSR